MRRQLEVKMSLWLRQPKKTLLEKGFFACLWVPSFCLKLFVKVRNSLYKRKFLSIGRSPLPIVSIGNVVVGGTGKTPVTLCLAQRLVSHCKVAILSRGYRSAAENSSPPLVLSKGNGPCFPSTVCGDEAFLLSSRVPEAIVIVGKNRMEAALEAKKEGAELILLDDGMQHRKLHRDIEIAVIGRENPFGSKFLPQGFLRDDPFRLNEADAIIVNGGSVSSTPGVPHIFVENRPVALEGIPGLSLEALKGTQVALFCGIGEPDRFVRTVEGLGAHLVESLFLADHEKIGEKDLQIFALRAKNKGAKCLLCTEKDAVKLFPNEGLSMKIGLPLGWIKSELRICQDGKNWEMLIERIKQLVKR